MNNEKRATIEKTVVELGDWPYNGVSVSLVNTKEDLIICTNKGMEIYTSGVEFTRAEFEQVKAEMQNKPSWDEAPEWANWLAQDEDGQWTWFQNEPEDKALLWDCKGKVSESCCGKPIGDWRNTLEKRKGRTDKQKSNWHERGEKPPAGTKCEVSHDGVFIPCFVVGLDSDGVGLVCKVERKTSRGIRVEYIPHYDCTFRPLRTERDELIDSLMLIMSEVDVCGGENARRIAESIVDADWRPTDSKDD